MSSWDSIPETRAQDRIFLSPNPKENAGSAAVTGTCIASATPGAVLMPSAIGHIADSIRMNAALKAILVPLSIMVILMVIKLHKAMEKDQTKKPETFC